VRAIAVVLIRLWAAHVAVQAIFDLKRSYPVLLSRLGVMRHDSDFSVFWSLSHLTSLMLGLILFLFARSAVRLLMPKVPGPEAEDADRVISAGTVLIGLAFLLQYLPFLLEAAVAQSRLETRPYVRSMEAEILLAAIVSVLSLCLIFRFRHFRQLRRDVNAHILKSFTPRSSSNQETDS